MTYTTQQLQAMTNPEINREIAAKYFGYPEDKDIAKRINSGAIDYCNNPNDIIPLAFERGICLVSPASPRVKKWTASYTTGGGKWPVDDFVFADTNPLRAIACLILMMDN